MTDFDEEYAQHERTRYDTFVRIAQAQVAEKKREEDNRLRDQFAMAALTGIMVGEWSDGERFDLLAQRAYSAADAMLAERAKEQAE